MARAWPESILGRAVLRDGFQYQRLPSVERTDMDSGLARGRIYNSNPLARVQCQFVFDEAQVAFFEAWLQDIALRGGAWFTIYLPLEGVTYRQVLARVVGEPARKPRGADRMLVAIEFEVHDSLIVPSGFIDLILTFGTTGVQDMDAALADLSLQPFFDSWAQAAGA